MADARHSQRSTCQRIQTSWDTRGPGRNALQRSLQIRLSLAMSQGEMVKRLGVQDLIHYTTISKYELDKNEPPLAILLAYARLAGIPVEQIIDDEVELTIWFPQKYRDRFLAINFPTTSRRGAHRVDVQFPNESLPSANSVTSAPRPFTDPSKERYRSLRCVGRSRVYAALRWTPRTQNSSLRPWLPSSLRLKNRQELLTQLWNQRFQVYDYYQKRRGPSDFRCRKLKRWLRCLHINSSVYAARTY